MAVSPLGVWGIDLGQCALKAIRLEVQGGEVVATAFEYIEHPKILSQPDADPDELTYEALSQFLERNSIKGDLICISVPGQAGLARFVKLPPVDQAKIADIVKFEAKQQIPFPLDEVVWDFQKLSTGEVIDGMALDTEIGLFAVKREMVLRTIKQLKEVNVEVHVVQMAPLGLCNFIAYDLLGKGTDNLSEEEEGHECIVCLEIGTDNSNLVITDGGRIIWQRPIPIGGNHFTRALTKEMKLTFAKAEHLKRNAAKSPELKKILSALKLVLNDFVGEVLRSLGYFTNTHRNAKIQYMIGLGNAFRLPGLQRFLQEKLQLEVRKLQRLERAAGESVTAAPTFTENIMSFGVAYGLALQGVQQARLQTNLLPNEIRRERFIRGKKPWMVAAAASLLFGMCLIAFARGMERDAVANPENIKAKSEFNQAVVQAETSQKNFIDEEKKFATEKGTLTKIGAGVEERLNWQYLHQYINMITPQPTGGRLTKKASQGTSVHDLYNNKDAKKAYDMLQAKRFGKEKDKEKEKELSAKEVQEREKFIKENLIQINITGINATFSEDLWPYYQQLVQDLPNLDGMDDTEQDNLRRYAKEPDPKQRQIMNPAPIRDGWVVEIRGYTYHRGKKDFVRHTLVENLRFPHNLKGLPLDDAMKPKIGVGDRLAHLAIYKLETFEKPVPGRFNTISKSYLKTLVKETQVAAVGEQPPVVTPGPETGPATPGKKNRDGWKPIGETAASIYVDAVGGIGAGFPGGLETKVAGAENAVPRTEFVVVFIWREPLGNEPVALAPGSAPAPVPTPEAKKN